MEAIQIVFSPTGGTGKAAEIITKALGMPAKKIDLTNKETDFSSLRFKGDDIAILAVPS